MTIREHLEAAVTALRAAGFSADDARVDASVIGRHLLGWTTAELLARSQHEAPQGFGERLMALVLRRTQHEPVAYITGVREFYGREFLVTPSVLIPRPETEALVEATIGIIGSGVQGSEAQPIVIDVGTGSGCLAITIALECPNARVFGTDSSLEAIALAAQNARRLGAMGVVFHEVRGAEFIPSDLPEADVIVSNPPYVAERDRASLPADVREFEPAAALFGGEDGLNVTRALLPAAARALKPGGTLIVEIGAGQDDAVVRIAAAAGLAVDRVVSDLQGIPRVVVARHAAAG